MKLPRWLMFSLLTSSVLAVFTAAGWWVTSPERTVHACVDVMAEDRVDEAEKMLRPSPRINKVLPVSGTEDGPSAWTQAANSLLSHGRRRQWRRSECAITVHIDAGGIRFTSVRC